jgi:two-component system chemotaxis response regulator CheY
MHFLVVDDSATVRRFIANSLRSIGYKKITEAADGEEALDKLTSHPIEFVITDWNMPKMSGLNLVKKIRQTPDYSHLPIIMITTRGSKFDVVAAVKAKINNYVVKPFTPEILKSKIDAVLKSLEK